MIEGRRYIGLDALNRLGAAPTTTDKPNERERTTTPALTAQTAPRRVTRSRRPLHDHDGVPLADSASIAPVRLRWM
jgi:hypothetical protein